MHRFEARHPEVPSPLSTRKSLAWSFSQEFGQTALRFVGSIIIARLLTPDEVGVFALAMAAHMLISSLQNFGMGSYLIREHHLTDDKIRTTFGMWLVISWTIGLALMLARNPIAELYSTPGIAEVLVLVACTFFIAPIGQPAQALLRRAMRFDILHHIELTSAMAGLITSIALAAYGFSYMALAWGMIAGTALRALLLISVHPDHLKLRPAFTHWREVLNFGGWLSGASITGTIAADGVKLVIGGLINPGAVALFERAGQIPKIARKSLFVPLGRVLLPAFAKDIREGRSIGPSVEKLVAASTVIIWPAFLTTAIVAEPIILLLFGENWRVAGEILPFLLASAALLPLLPQPEPILTPHGKVRRLFALRSFQAVSSLTFAAIGAAHSLEMFAVLRIPAAALFVSAIFLATRPYLGVNLPALIPHYLRATAIALVCAVPAVAAHFIHGGNIPIPTMLGVCAAAPIIWLLAVYISRPPIYSEIELIAAKGASLLRKRLGYIR